MTQTQEPTELDCSAGAKMLIERMKTNPEDFDFGGRLYSVHERRHMSARDKDAVLDAYDKYIVEPKFMAEVLLALTAPVETEEQAFKAYTSGRSGGKSMLGNAVVDTRAIYGNQASPIYGPDTHTYSTATQQIISHELIEQQRRHLQAHEEQMELRRREVDEQRKLSWPEKIKGMF